MKDQFETKMSPDSITDAEMLTYFEEHKNEYNKPEEVRVSAIIVKSQGQAATVAKQALSEEGKTNKGFRELVSKFSTDEKTKIRGGDLRYFSRDSKELPKAVIDMAFAQVKTGDVAGPIKGEDNRYYIIKQTGKRKAITKTFDQVKRQIKNRLYRERRTTSQKDFITDLKKKAKIEIFEANLSKVKIDISETVSGDDGHGHGDPGSAADKNLPSMPMPDPHGGGDDDSP
jgi:parvulin-like peptidyl-prolyl isomerase